MCKAAHMEYHEGGNEDNSIDESDKGSIQDKSWDYSMISVHLNSIGFSLGTVLVIVLIIGIWKFSSKTCMRKALYIFCPCCLNSLLRERMDRHERIQRQRESMQFSESQLIWNPPQGSKSLSLPRSHHYMKPRNFPSTSDFSTSNQNIPFPPDVTRTPLKQVPAWEA